jgi:FdhE protein
VCGGWPTLAEMRGLEREHWLRCGRCSAGWRYPQIRCVFCGEEEHEQRGYLAAESERESRRAMTCATCHGYLKTFATLAALSAADLLAKDLTSVELDLAALEADYRRPEAPGYRLELRIEPLRKRGGWLGWRS